MVTWLLAQGQLTINPPHTSWTPPLRQESQLKSLREDKVNESWVAMRLPLAGRGSQEPGAWLQLSSLLGSGVY